MKKYCWTPEQCATAARIYAENYKDCRFWGQDQTFNLIAKTIERTPAAVRTRYFERGSDFTGPQLAKHKINRYNNKDRRASIDNEIYENVRPPESVLAERERRYNLLPRDLTSALMGDPLPTCSALDLK